jgi:hypothetical protein
MKKRGENTMGVIDIDWQDQGRALRARLEPPKPEEYWDGVHTGSGRKSDSDETEVPVK